MKKKQDARVKGGVSFESFLAMKQAGEFEEFNLHEDKQMASMFLQ